MGVNESYPKPIREFFELYEESSTFSDNDFEETERILQDFEHYLLSEYKRLYPKGKELKSEYILNQIFDLDRSKFDEKQYIKIHLTSILRQLNQFIFSTYYDIKQNLEEGEYKRSELRKNLIFIYHFMDDFMQFYANHYEIFHRSEKGFVLMRRFEPVSEDDLIHLSENLLYGKLDGYYGFDYYSIHKAIPATISLLRTTIELVIKNSLGIRKLTYSNGSPLKVSSFIFLDFIKENQDHLNFPIEFSIVRKIYEWSNHFIHDGEVSYHWMISEAFNAVSKFFPFAGNLDNLLKYDEEFYESREPLMKDYISKRLNVESSEVHLELIDKIEWMNLKKRTTGAKNP